MTFDQWMTSINSRHRPLDDNVSLRILRSCWAAAQAEQREADAKLCERYMGGDGELNADGP